MITHEKLLESLKTYNESIDEKAFDALLKKFAVEQPAIAEFLVDITEDCQSEEEKSFLLDQSMFIYKTFKDTYPSFRPLTDEEVSEVAYPEDTDEDGETDDEADDNDEPDFTSFMSMMAMEFYDFEAGDYFDELKEIDQDNMNGASLDKIIDEKIDKMSDEMMKEENEDFLFGASFLTDFVTLMDKARIKTPLRVA